MRQSYLQLRKFHAGVLNEVPITSLDQVRFEKQRAADATIEAQIKLTLFLAGRELVVPKDATGASSPNVGVAA